MRTSVMRPVTINCRLRPLHVRSCAEDVYKRQVYDREVARQVEEVKAQSKIHSVDELLHSGATWEIE